MASKDTVGAGASTLVGRYELFSPVVSGALGELWHARIASGPEQGRIVDIRRVSRAVGLEKRDLERFTNAGFAAMELRNPRIAAVLDLVVGATEIAIVSEHVAGAVMQRIVNPEPGKRVGMPSGVASRIALDLLEAIDALREPWAEIFPSNSAEDTLLRMSLHGGLLPDGLLVASFGEAMLLEAGVAGVALTVPAILDRPEVIAYRAPEQLEPGRPIDERTDVFTVGVLLWEMISGQSLFGPTVLPNGPALAAPARTSADPIAVSGARRRVLSHRIARLDALPLSKGNVPKELADWIARCLERDPERRFANVRDAIASLSALGEGLVSPHGDVVAFIESLGLSEPSLPETEQSAGPSSNRQTTPPVEDATPSKAVHEGVTRPGLVVRRSAATEAEPEKSHDGATQDFGETARAHAARMLEQPDSIPPSTGAESPPPSEPEPSTDMESLPPSEPTPATHVDASGLEQQASDQIENLAAGEVTTSAPVVWPLGDQGASGSIGADEPAFPTSRDRSKKLVLAVAAAAVLLVIVPVLRVAFVSGPASAPAAQPAPPTTQAVAGEPPAPRLAPEAVPAPSVEPPAQASAAAPTSVPALASGNPTENSVRKAGSANAANGANGANGANANKKRPWRPSGI